MLADLRLALRSLARHRRLSFFVIALLALGGGAAIALFSVVDAALFRPLPFRAPDRLVTLDRVTIPVREDPGRADPDAPPDIVALAAMRDIFAEVGAYAIGQLNLGGGKEPLRVQASLVTPSFFSVLGARPFTGRPFDQSEGMPDGERVVILSDALWRTSFGADSTMVGRIVRLNDTPYRVVGIMPSTFRFPAGTALWTPLTVPLAFGRLDAFGSSVRAHLVARLALGVPFERASVAVRAGSSRRAKGERTSDLQPLREDLTRNGKSMLLMLLGATALVLLSACVNVATLLLARAAARRRELAVRVALGASRRRLIQQLVSENGILALAGGLGAVLLAWWGAHGLGALLPAELIDVVAPQLDGRVLSFALALTLLTGVLFGVVPAVRAAATDPAEAVKAGAGRGATAGSGSAARRVFVTSQVALAVVGMISAGLLLRSFVALVSTPSGLRADHVATLEVSLDRARYPHPASRLEFTRALLTRLTAQPTIAAAAAVNQLPLGGQWGMSLPYEIPGRALAANAPPDFAQYLLVTPGYFHALGIGLEAGRDFTTADDSVRPAIIINRMMSTRIWPGENPLGRRIKLPMESRPRTVVGVVGNVRTTSLDAEPEMQMYLPIEEAVPPSLGIVVHGDGDSDGLLAALRDAVRAIDADQPAANARMLDAVIASSLFSRRLNTLFVTLFGLITVGLAGLGVYAMVTETVIQRTREISIRLAVGATRRDVMILVLLDVMRLAAVGVTIGLAGALIVTRWMRGMLYAIQPLDSATFALGALLIFVVALASSSAPILRAMRLQPVEALQAD